jgi:hypothetical protein
MTTSGRQVSVSPEFMTAKSGAHLFGEPLFYPPTSQTVPQHKHAPINVFFEELWPTMFVQKLLGIFPYEVSPTGKFF